MFKHQPSDIKPLLMVCTGEHISWSIPGTHELLRTRVMPVNQSEDVQGDIYKSYSVQFGSNPVFWMKADRTAALLSDFSNGWCNLFEQTVRRYRYSFSGEEHPRVKVFWYNS